MPTTDTSGSRPLRCSSVIEYHPASDGQTVKTPDDSVTVDIQTRALGHFVAKDLGQLAAAEKVRKQRDEQDG
jgi:hypothetical protein